MTSLFVANFGKKGALNGQVQKALAVLDLLNGRGTSVETLDVSDQYLSLLKLPLRHLGHERIYLSLGQNGIRAALVLLLLRTLLGRKTPPVCYLAVGGWLHDLVGRSLLTRKLLHQADMILVESEALRDALSTSGYRAAVFPNFRSMPPQPAKGLARKGSLRLCFCSRVRWDKGIVDAIGLVERLNAEGIDATLDVHGPLELDDPETFHDLIANNSRARWCGTYESDRAVELIGQYDFLILPTRYPGECMPGAVVEAFCAATPVLCTDWRFMAEYVEHGHDGLLGPSNNFVEGILPDLLRLLAQDLYFSMSKAAVETYNSKYSRENADRIFEGLLEPPPQLD